MTFLLLQSVEWILNLIIRFEISCQVWIFGRYWSLKLGFWSLLRVNCWRFRQLWVRFSYVDSSIIFNFIVEISWLDIKFTVYVNKRLKNLQFFWLFKFKIRFSSVDTFAILVNFGLDFNWLIKLTLTFFLVNSITVTLNFTIQWQSCCKNQNMISY